MHGNIDSPYKLQNMSLLVRYLDKQTVPITKPEKNKLQEEYCVHRTKFTKRKVIEKSREVQKSKAHFGIESD